MCDIRSIRVNQGDLFSLTECVVDSLGRTRAHISFVVKYTHKIFRMIYQVIVSCLIDLIVIVQRNDDKTSSGFYKNFYKIF